MTRLHLKLTYGHGSHSPSRCVRDWESMQLLLHPSVVINSGWYISYTPTFRELNISLVYYPVPDRDSPICPQNFTIAGIFLYMWFTPPHPPPIFRSIIIFPPSSTPFYDCRTIFNMAVVSFRLFWVITKPSLAPSKDTQKPLLMFFNEKKYYPNPNLKKFGISNATGHCTVFTENAVETIVV